MDARRLNRRERRGFSLMELIIVLVIMGTIAALTIPKLNLSGNRVEAIAQQMRSVLMTAQRTSITRQFDVIISIDTARSELRIAEDTNNNNIIDPGEVRLWRPTGQSEGNIFSVPPRGFSTPTVTSSVVGSSLSQVGGLPSITFHRDGSASSDAEVYVSNSSRGRTEFRLVTLTRSTGRTDMYKLAGTGSAAKWIVSR
jgi:prepilin-type N-terminal cleavage/methylation domain-containing protein